MQKLEAEKKELNDRIDRLKKAEAQEQQFRTEMGSLKERLKQLGSNLDKFSDQQRGEFLRLVLHRIEVDCISKGNYRLVYHYEAGVFGKINQYSYSNKNNHLLHNSSLHH